MQAPNPKRRNNTQITPPEGKEKDWKGIQKSDIEESSEKVLNLNDDEDGDSDAVFGTSAMRATLPIVTWKKVLSDTRCMSSHSSYFVRVIRYNDNAGSDNENNRRHDDEELPMGKGERYLWV